MQFGADCFVADEDELEEIKKKVLAQVRGPTVPFKPPAHAEMQVRFFEYGQQGVVPPEWEKFLPPES